MLYFRYILSIQNTSDQEQYLLEMLDKSNPVHTNFIDEFKDKFCSKSGPEPTGMRMYRKADQTEDYFSGNVHKSSAGSKSQNINNASEKSIPSTDRDEVDFMFT